MSWPKWVLVSFQSLSILVQFSKLGDNPTREKSRNAVIALFGGAVICALVVIA